MKEDEMFDLTYFQTKALYDNYIKSKRDLESQFNKQHEKIIKLFSDRGIYEEESDYILQKIKEKKES